MKLDIRIIKLAITLMITFHTEKAQTIDSHADDYIRIGQK
jgi:hypothetical protein